MAEPEKTDGKRWALWDLAQRTAIEWLAVVISALAFLLTVLIAIVAAIMAGVSMWVAYDAHEEAKIYGIYVKNLHADLIAQGFDPPPLPPEEEEE